MSVEQSVIHDIGYQRYTGQRLGRGYAVRSLYSHGLRTAFGFGRSAKAKIFPWLVFGIVLGVGGVITAVRSVIGESLLSYTEFSDGVNLLVLLFLAVVAPELVSRDLRGGVLPLYFSRPLQRSDYALAKLAALASAVWLLLAAPLLLMFVGGAFGVKGGMSAVWTEFTDFLPGLIYAGCYAVVFSSIALFVASLSGRRAVAAAIIVGVFLVTIPVVGVLSVVGGDTLRQTAGMASPMTVMSGVRSWLFPDSDPESGSSFIGDYGPLYAATAVALVLLSVGFLLARYRKVAR